MTNLTDTEAILLGIFFLVAYLSILMWQYGDRWFRNYLRDAEGIFYMQDLALFIRESAQRDGKDYRNLTEAERNSYLGKYFGNSLEKWHSDD